MGAGRVLFAGLLLTVVPAYAEAFGGRDAGNGCGHQGRLRVAWLANDPLNTYDLAALEGVSSKLDAVDGEIETFYAGYDPTLQLSQCTAAVRSRKLDALLVIAADSNAIIPCVTLAKSYGVAVVAVDLPIGPDVTTVEPQVSGQTGAVLVPPAAWGFELATLVVDACSGVPTCEVAYLAGGFSIAPDQFALAQLDAVAATHSNVRIVAREEVFYDRGLATVATQGILQAHPNVRVILGSGDQMAQGAEDAIALQPPAAPIKIVGAGASEYGVNAVRDGRWYATLVALPRDEGEFAAEIAIRAVLNRPIADRGINPVEERGFPAFFKTDNQDSFDGFEPQWQ